MQEMHIIRILFLFAISFGVAILWTPLLTHFLYKYKMGKQIRTSDSAPVFAKMHAKKSGTPTMGGILIWVTVLFFSLFFFYTAKLINIEWIQNLNFLTRAETLLPLGALVASALLGLLDDWFNVKKLGPKGGGLGIKHRLVLFLLIAIVGAAWFFFKLDWDLLHVPFVGDFSIGWWYIPVFIFIIVATSFSVNEIDGLDGLAGGVLMTCFATYGGIAFAQGKFDLAAFCAVIAGALLAFLWFNINPARFFMGDTGSMALGVTLGIVAMLTNYALLLPIIGFLLVIESLSVIIQLTSKKIRKKKVFKSAPIHHHFEAIGWSEPKVVRRFWIISAISCALGFALFLLDKGF